MTINRNPDFLSYLGRFVFVHLMTITAVAFVFVSVQEMLPPVNRIALDFFKPFSFDLLEAPVQILRGAVMAIVLYPFYDLIVRSKNAAYVLFAALWGLVLLGSLEPAPGTIEGMIYTETSLLEHLLVLIAGAIQVALFIRFFLRWERAGSIGNEGGKDGSEHVKPGKILSWSGGRHIFRFTILHLLVYWLVGSLFYQISGYEEALAEMEAFTLYRPLENLTMVAAVFFGQIFRGALISQLLYPFYDSYIRNNKGWLLLFGLLCGLQVLTAIVFIPVSLAEFRELAFGVPEIVAQTLLFSLLFFAWEKRRLKKLSPEEK